MALIPSFLCILLLVIFLVKICIYTFQILLCLCLGLFFGFVLSFVAFNDLLACFSSLTSYWWDSYACLLFITYKYALCNQDLESFRHLFLTWPCATTIWDFIRMKFEVNLDLSNSLLHLFQQAFLVNLSF